MISEIHKINGNYMSSININEMMKRPDNQNINIIKAYKEK